jgi:hypothetical protein
VIEVARQFYPFISKVYADGGYDHDRVIKAVEAVNLYQRRLDLTHVLGFPFFVRI